MPRITPIEIAPPKSEEILARFEKALGARPALFRTMAHSPATLGMYAAASSALASSSLSGPLREQIALAVAGQNHCDYCASAHTAIGAANGLENTEMEKNLHGDASDARSAAALQFATTIVQKRGLVGDGDLSAARNAGFNDAELLDIISVTVFNIMTNYINHVAETEVDFPLVETAAVTA